MAQSESSKAVDEIVRGVAPLLRAAGYRRSARSFHLTAEGVSRVVQFQASQWNTPEEASFTINLLVTAPRFHEAYSGRPFPKNPGSACPVIQERIGSLLPEAEDRWWKVRQGMSLEPIAQEVGDALSRYGLPFLDRFGSAARLLEMLDKGERLPGIDAMVKRCHTVLLVEAGRTDDARRLLLSLIGASTLPGGERFRQSIRDLAERLGVSLDGPRSQP